MDPPESSHVRNPYDVLGVSPDASPDEIRDAYWRLVRFYRTEGETAWTATHLGELQDAYELLSDPSRRAELDAANGGGPSPLVQPQRHEPGASPFPPPEPVVRHHSHNPVDRLTRRLPRPWRKGELAASACSSGRCSRSPLQTRMAVAASGIPTWTCSAHVGVRLMSP